jgi:cytochrome c oxidase subunit 2
MSTRNSKRWGLGPWALGLLLLSSVLTAQSAQKPDRRVVRVSAERFAFTPSEISVTVGEEIELRVKSDDTSHGFRIIGTETDVAIPKRGQGETVVVFKAPAAGKFEIECSRMCGAGHSFMRGVIVAKEPK